MSQGYLERENLELRRQVSSTQLSNPVNMYLDKNQ